MYGHQYSPYGAPQFQMPQYGYGAGAPPSRQMAPPRQMAPRMGRPRSAPQNLAPRMGRPRSTSRGRPKSPFQQAASRAQSPRPKSPFQQAAARAQSPYRAPIPPARPTAGYGPRPQHPQARQRMMPPGAGAGRGPMMPQRMAPPAQHAYAGARQRGYPPQRMMPQRGYPPQHMMQQQMMPQRGYPPQQMMPMRRGYY